MLLRASIIVNIIFSIFIICLGFIALFNKEEREHPFLFVLTCIFTAFPISVIMDIFLLRLYRLNRLEIPVGKGFRKAVNTLLVLNILGSLFVITFIYLAFSAFFSSGGDLSTMLGVMYMLVLFCFIICLVTNIINIIFLKKGLKINKNLFSEIVNKIGDDIHMNKKSFYDQTP